MKRLILFGTFIFCLTFLNFITNSQDHLPPPPPLLEDPYEDFVSEFNPPMEDEGIKYYIKIIPGDTTVDKNIPMYEPDSKVFTEPPVKSVLENPKPIVTVNPNISEIEITKPVKVWVKGLVDKEGNIQDLKILKSDVKILNEPVLNAVTQWKFKPAVLNGNAIPIYVSIPFEFTPKK